jgi:hypothetical protein
MICRLLPESVTQPHIDAGRESTNIYTATAFLREVRSLDCLDFALECLRQSNHWISANGFRYLARCIRAQPHGIEAVFVSLGEMLVDQISAAANQTALKLFQIWCKRPRPTSL